MLSVILYQRLTQNTTMESTTFAYSEEEGKRIITSASLLDGIGEMPFADNRQAREICMDLKRLQEKDIKLDLNAIQLSDYWRKGYSPRGLRIKKFPSFDVTEKTEFKAKWEKILSKCSSDLMLLLIEEARKDRVVIQQKMEDLNKKLEEFNNNKDIEDLRKRLDDNISKFKEQLKQDKIRKFQRDEVDYKENRVYFWTKAKTTRYHEAQQRGPRTV